MVMVPFMDMSTIMDKVSLLRLMTWLSPSYPVGAYTYSHALEYVVELEEITDVDTSKDWLSGIVKYGAGQSDIVLLHTAYQAALNNDVEALKKCAEFSVAFCGTKELELETQAQGRAFLDITRKSWHTDTLDLLTSAWQGPYTYPVVVGVAAAGHKIGLAQTAYGYLHAFVANLISALVRLVPLGQTDGQILIAELEPLIIDTADQALSTSIDNISNACLMIDISSMQHEQQHTRLFRS